MIYGFTGLVMNHRFGDGAWPQGKSEEIARVTLQMPGRSADLAGSVVAVAASSTQGLDAQVIRKGPPGGGRGEGAEGRRSEEARRAEVDALSGGTAKDAWSLEYTPGKPTAEVKHTRNDTLAAFNRLHKAVGGGIGWTHPRRQLRHRACCCSACPASGCGRADATRRNSSSA